MSHELEIVNGKAMMAYAGDTPWHGLGTRVNTDLAPREMMVEAGLDWGVEKHPCFIDINGSCVDFILFYTEAFSRKYFKFWFKAIIVNNFL